MTERQFFPQMKMADIINSNLALAPLIPRLDMDFGFGDKTIKQTCDMYNNDCYFVLLIFNVYSFPEYFPQESEIRTIKMDNLLSFLTSSHKYYLLQRLPHIGEHWNKITQNMGMSQQNVLRHFFEEYQNEVANHFEYEEQIVFPYIKGLCNGNTSTYNIHQFEKNHSNIEDKLSDIIHIVIKYLPKEIPSEDRISILEDIAILQKDINRHALIENKILIPFVEFIENQKHETL